MKNDIFVNYEKPLHTVLLCSPKYFKIIKPINYTETKTFKNGIRVILLIKEHLMFLLMLKKHKVKVKFLKPLKHCPHQTFVRDLGFVLEDTVYLGKSNIDLRRNEKAALLDYLGDYEKVYHFNNYLEGGDVVIYKNNIFIGISNRTSIKAVNELKEILGHKYNIVALELRDKVLHLDTVMNFVGDIMVVNLLGISTKFNPHDYVDLVIKTYLGENIYLPTNFLAVNHNTIIANSNCVRTNAALRKAGVNVTEVNFSEMVKLGGAFRCCSLEVVKK